MKKVYLINEFDRWCPQNNHGDSIVAAFSTRELAEEYVDNFDPKNEDGRREYSCGLEIREIPMDMEVTEYSDD